MTMCKKLALFGALCAASSTALAATVDLSVTGTIVPPSCTPALTNAGVIDFGDITSLSSTATTTLPAKSITLTVSCTGNTLIGLSFQDNKAASVLASGGAAEFDFGLGMNGINKIGRYRIDFMGSNALVDGGAAKVYDSADSGATWTAGSVGAGRVTNAPTKVISFSPAAGTAPTPIQALEFPMDVELTLNTSVDIGGVISDIPLDGSNTIEIKYL